LNRYGGVKNDSFVCKSLPSSKDIELTVLKARKDAEEKLNALGIRVDGGTHLDLTADWHGNQMLY
jgi:hypothetical protein